MSRHKSRPARPVTALESMTHMLDASAAWDKALAAALGTDDLPTLVSHRHVAEQPDATCQAAREYYRRCAAFHWNLTQRRN